MATFKLGGLRREYSDIETGEIKVVRWPDSLHTSAVELACWVAREAASGLYPAKAGFDLIENWWNEQWAKPRPAHKRVKPTRKEWAGVQSWAVAQASSDPERLARIRAKSDADLEAWKQAQAKRKRDALARWIEECSI